MRKNLLIFFVCIGICTCAYRFGDLNWNGAKTTITKEVHSTITKLMFPMLTVYDIPNGYLVCQDVGQLILPVLGVMEEDELLATKEEVDKGMINGSEDELLQNEELLQVPDDKSPDTTEELRHENTQQVQENESGSEVAEAVSILEKQVTINRQKLQDFDYLRQNFYQVDNSTTVSSELLDVNKLLEKDLTIAEGVDGPQILIYHTHSQEGYADSIEGDASTSVVAVGEYLTQLLTQQYGIEVLHHTGQYDVEEHADAYSNALPAIKEVLAQNPTIEVVIDLHRDGVPSTTHLVTEVNGKPTAQLMFFNGLSRTTSKGELTYLKNPYIEDNLAFSFQMQLAAAEYYPGLARKIYLKGYRYNMHVCPKTMLVEVGAQTNTLQEAKNAMEPLAALLAEVLK